MLQEWMSNFSMNVSKGQYMKKSVACCAPGVGAGIFLWGADSSHGGLKYGYQGTINAKNLQTNSFLISDGGLACSDEDVVP